MRALRIARGAACWALLLALAAGAAPAADAQEAALRGKISYQLGYGYTEEELVENALCAELDVERRFGSGKVHIGLDAAVRAAVPAGEETASLELDEAYADVYLDAADLRIGRQVISWGTADGFNPTNVVNPRGPLSPAWRLLSGAPPKGRPATRGKTLYNLPPGPQRTGGGAATLCRPPRGD
nr:hypothetical protein [Bacillota bacterium]